MLSAETLVKRTAKLIWVDPHGWPHSERHAAWNARRATTMAYRRARSMMFSGQAAAFRIEHHQRPFDGGSAQLADDPFAIPDAA